VNRPEGRWLVAGDAAEESGDVRGQTPADLGEPEAAVERPRILVRGVDVEHDVLHTTLLELARDLGQELRREPAPAQLRRDVQPEDVPERRVADVGVDRADDPPVLLGHERVMIADEDWIEARRRVRRERRLLGEAVPEPAESGEVALACAADRHDTPSRSAPSR
jgi:hypothetical protein